MTTETTQTTGKVAVGAADGSQLGTPAQLGPGLQQIRQIRQIRSVGPNNSRDRAASHLPIKHDTFFFFAVGKAWVCCHHYTGWTYIYAAWRARLGLVGGLRGLHQPFHGTIYILSCPHECCLMLHHVVLVCLPTALRYQTVGVARAVDSGPALVGR